MRHFLISVIVVSLLGLVSQTGCVYYASYDYFHTAQQTGYPERFEFRLGSETFRSRIMPSRTIVVLPFVVFIPGHNPFHFSLLQEQLPGETGRVTRIELRDGDGNILLSSASDDDMISGKTSSDAGGFMNVLTRNPNWRESERRYRRRSSTDGWSNTRPVRIPHGCTDLFLKVWVATDISEEVPLRERSTEVHLKRFTGRESGLVTDSIFGVTGGFYKRPPPHWGFF